MTFLPIVTRELRVASRRRSTYWLRTGATLVLILLGTWLFLLMKNEQPQALAKYLFGILTGSSVLYALLSGVRATADCLSEEKREGTLGLLFLTDLKGYDVVLGKLMANSVNAIYSVVAVVPVLAIPLLMGGLTSGEFGRMALVAVNSLFFSLAVGIFVSAVSRSAQKAMFVTLALIFVVTAVLPALGAFYGRLGRVQRLDWLFFLPSAGFSYYLAWDVQYRLQTEMFWYSVLFLHLTGWACLVVASIITPRTWQDRSTGEGSLRWRERWRLWTFGSNVERAVFRRQLLSRNAFFWLASRARLKPVLVWGFLAVAACIWSWGLAKQRRDWLVTEVYVMTALSLNFVFKVWFAAEATSRLAQDRKAGTLELLLSTPLDVPDILHGQLLALTRQFLGPLVVILIVESIFMLAMLSEPTEADHLFWALLWISGMVMLIADLVSLYWVGMWQGLTAKNVGRATSASLSRILVFPWIAFAVVLVLGAARGANRFDSWQGFYPTLWFVLGALTDFGFSGYARYKLMTEFRLVAQQRYAPSAGIFARVLGALSAEREPPPKMARVEG
jgi:ABC-type transport system involved in multi-copper enzyme maturation permease subunit